jgi:hypothetical protein
MGFRRKAGGFPEALETCGVGRLFPAMPLSLALFSRPGLEPALEMLARPPTKRPGLGRGPTIPLRS